MIVKDEAAVIVRCLASIKPFIDYWVIVDTGSTDGTQEVIKKYMYDIPGVLYQSNWVNFSYNRNEALRLSDNKGEYILFIDADEQFLPDPDFSFSFLKGDYYLCPFTMENGQQFQKVLVIKNSPHFFWVGAVHEMIANDEKTCRGILVDKAKVAYLSGGYRSRDSLTFEKDALLLKQEVEKHPKNTRSLFFLALTYERLNHLELALEYFEKRSQLLERDQEVFYSILSIGLIQMRQGKPAQIFLKTLEKAHHLIETRPEPIYFLSITYESQGKLQKAYNLLSPFVYSFDRSSIGYQTFFNLNIAEIEIPVLYARICFRLLKYEESCKVFEKIKSNPSLPKEKIKYIESYLRKMRPDKEIKSSISFF